MGKILSAGWLLYMDYSMVSIVCVCALGVFFLFCLFVFKKMSNNTHHPIPENHFDV